VDTEREVDGKEGQRLHSCRVSNCPRAAGRGTLMPAESCNLPGAALVKQAHDAHLSRFRFATEDPGGDGQTRSGPARRIEWTAAPGRRL